MSGYIIHFDTSDYIAHIGTKNSGRYPRGSGERPHQHDGLLARFRRKKNTSQKNQPIKPKEFSKDVSKMSDQELREYVNRMKLTKEAKELTTQLVNKNTNAKIKKDGAFIKAGRRIAETALAGAGLYLLKASIGKEFDRKELANYVARGGAAKK